MDPRDAARRTPLAQRRRNLLANPSKRRLLEARKMEREAEKVQRVCRSLEKERSRSELAMAHQINLLRAHQERERTR